MNSLPGLSFHHFGMAARDPARAMAFLGSLGYECGPPVHDPLQDAVLHWCVRQGQPAVEVVSAPATGQGPLAALLAQQGTSFYHLCFEVEKSLEASLADMAAAGLRIATVRQSLPAVLFGGRRVSFHVVQGFGLVELLEPSLQ